MIKILLTILVLGGVSFFVFRDNSSEYVSDQKSSINENSQSGESNKEESKSEDFKEKTTLASLMNKGGNYRCVFSHSTSVSDSTGTVYIAGKKIRGDFVSKVNIQGLGGLGNVETHMISDGESVYSWSSMSKEGYKSPINSETKTESSVEIPTDKELDYSCVGWAHDDTKFSLPVNIIFKTI